MDPIILTSSKPSTTSLQFRGAAKMSPLSARTNFDFKPLLLLLFLLLQLAVADPISLIDDVVSGMQLRRKWGGVGEQREFDYFILSLQWPATTCNRQQDCCSSNACCRGSNAPTEFTIHGLWPQYNDGKWPSCCSTSNFNEKEISTLLDPIQKYWPSLSCGKAVNCHHKKGSFWAHEWEKHGTCSFPAIRDEYNYFLTTLNLYLKYNVTNVLRDAGYVPSDTEKYPLGGIIEAIENAFHETPMVTCSNGAVKELWLCFYKDFKPRDCVQSSYQNELIFAINSCPKYVSLPTYESDERNRNGVFIDI